MPKEDILSVLFFVCDRTDAADVFLFTSPQRKSARACARAAVALITARGGARADGLARGF